jgi:hypothetical protein
MGSDYKVNKNYVLPTANARFRYNFAKSKRLTLSYNFNTSFASASQLCQFQILVMR